MDMSKPVIRLCEHYFAGGKRCGSPAMKHPHFCYYHRANRTVRGREIIPPLHNPRSIQKALGNVMQGILSGRISSEDAGRLLYGIQTAMRTME
jgi:hypothetical protein